MGQLSLLSIFCIKLWYSQLWKELWKKCDEEFPFLHLVVGSSKLPKPSGSRCLYLWNQGWVKSVVYNPCPQSHLRAATGVDQGRGGDLPVWGHLPFMLQQYNSSVCVCLCVHTHAQACVHSLYLSALILEEILFKQKALYLKIVVKTLENSLSI